MCRVLLFISCYSVIFPPVFLLFTPALSFPPSCFSSFSSPSPVWSDFPSPVLLHLTPHASPHECVCTQSFVLLSLSVHSLFSYFSPVWLLCFTWAYSSLRYISVLLFLLFFFFIPCVFIDLYFSFRCPLFQILWCNLAFFFGIDTYWFCFLWLLDYSAFSLRACFSSIFSPVFLCLDPNCALLLPPGAAKHVRLLFGAGVQWVCHRLRQLSPLLRLLMKKNQSSFNFWYFDFILLIIYNLQ